METKIKVALMVAAIVFLLAWAPWLNDQAIHDKVLQEKGRKDGTIQPIENNIHLENISKDALQEMIETSRNLGVTDGIVICDYKVSWFPFGRYVASCEGGYFVTFYGEISP